MSLTKKPIINAIQICIVIFCVGYIISLNVEIQELNEKLELSMNTVEFLEISLELNNIENEWLEELTIDLLISDNENYIEDNEIIHKNGEK